MGDGLLHIDRLGLMNRTYVPCCVCGKVFPKTGEHAYRVCLKGEEYYSCSWTCHRAKKAEAEAIKEAENAKKRRKTPLKELPPIEEAGTREKTVTRQERIALAMSRIKECEKKIERWSAKAREARPNTRERKNARNNASEWRKKLKTAQEELARL